MRPYHLLPAVPLLALVIMPFLPFVNTSARWLGLPRMFVWGAASCLLLAPALILADRLIAREEDGDR
jgi:hypothetical protein